MKKSLKSLLFPFQYSVVGFALCFLVLIASIFFGGNRPEYIAVFNIIVGMVFLQITFKSSDKLISLVKIIWLPCLILLYLGVFGYYRHIHYTDHTDNISSTAITDFIMQTGIYNPVGHFWHLIYWISIFLMSLLAFIAGGYSGFKRGFVKFFFVISVLIACYGIIIYAFGNQTILWYDKDAYFDDLTATFINRNSYAIFAGSGVLVGLYHITKAYQKFMRDYQGNHKTRIVGLIDYASSINILYVVATLILCAALILTHSRAGISLTIGFTCLFYFLASQKRYLNQRFVIVLIAIIIISLIAPFIMQDFLMRATTLKENAVFRENTYHIVLKMITDYPLSGVGMGGFEYAFQAYRDGTIAINNYWDKAHSTLLEVILELGIPLATTLFAFYVYIFTVIIKSYMRYKQSFLVLSLSICGLYITHSLVDFSLQIPAINIMFHIMLAMGYAQAIQEK